MPASLSTKVFRRNAPLRENLHCVRAAGFTHLHFAHMWKARDYVTRENEEEWMHALADCGMQVLDAHGCHPKDVDLDSDVAENREAAVAQLIHRIQLTHRLGGDAVVYHVPTRRVAEPRHIHYLLEGVKKVEDTARELGICIAMENHYIPENDKSALETVFEAFDADFIGFTFDPGHALISGNTDWILRTCGSRLRILHLNDNDGKGDRHWLPFDPEGKADWPRIMRFIAESPYDKPLQLEINLNLDRYGDHDTYLAKAYQTVQTLADMMQSA